MQIEKYWSELLMVMCEDEQGHVRAGDERLLMGLWMEDFYTKLLVFKERMDLRIELMQKRNGKTNA